jgi:hypothetical protein
MILPYEWQVGWRCTRAGRTGRRNGFISFISGVSMLGIALGVAALIIVLSVMNGFRIRAALQPRQDDGRLGTGFRLLGSRARLGHGIPVVFRRDSCAHRLPALAVSGGPG